MKATKTFSTSGVQDRLREEIATTPSSSTDASPSAATVTSCGGRVHLDAAGSLPSTATLRLLLDAVAATGVPRFRDAALACSPTHPDGTVRSMHHAFRAAGDGGTRLTPEPERRRAADHLERALRFADDVRSGRATTPSGESFRDVVAVGIGGARLGPEAVVGALRNPGDPGPRVHFLSADDGCALEAIAHAIDPARTLVVASSLSFSTPETLANLARMREIVASAVGSDEAAGHLAAVTAVPERAVAAGVPGEAVVPVPEGTVGRYSVWSPAGLPAMIALGTDVFRDFLAGGSEMDRHFASAPEAENLPVLLGAAGWFQAVAARRPVRTITAYDSRLAAWTAHARQLEMESLGKSASPGGGTASAPGCASVLADTGTDAQHAHFQALHQGADVFANEFVAVARGPTHEPREARRSLLSAWLAQEAAMRRGDPDAGGVSAVPGGRPTLSVILRDLSPRTLGNLMALHENRVLVEAAMRGVDPFDQPGVELGKRLARDLAGAASGGVPADADAATARLADALARQRNSEP